MAGIVDMQTDCTTAMYQRVTSRTDSRSCDRQLLLPRPLTLRTFARPPGTPHPAVVTTACDAGLTASPCCGCQQLQLLPCRAAHGAAYTANTLPQLSPRLQVSDESTLQLWCMCMQLLRHCSSPSMAKWRTASSYYPTYWGLRITYNTRITY